MSDEIKIKQLSRIQFFLVSCLIIWVIGFLSHIHIDTASIKKIQRDVIQNQSYIIENQKMILHNQGLIISNTIADDHK